MLRVINFDQEAWLKPYTELNENAKKRFRKRFLQANDLDRFYKNYGECEKAKKNFSDNLLAIDMKRIWILMTKPIYLGLSIIEVNKLMNSK